MIRMIRNTDGKTLYFATDEQGMPTTFGYPTHKQAVEVAALIQASDGEATIPDGVDVEKLIASQR